MKHILTFSKIILLFTFIALINTNCKPKTKTSNVNSPVPAENKKIPVSVENISGVYTITGTKLISGGTEKDIYPGLDECQKNNTYGFNKDLVWYLGGVARQDCTGPDESGTWSLSGNTLTINSQQSGTYEYAILDFDGKILVTESTADNNGTQEKMITTFTKK